MNWKDFAKKNSDWISYINVDSFNQIFFTTKGKHYKELFLIDDDVFHLLNLSELDDNKQRAIIDFVSQDPKKWYEEHKYYIIVGKDADNDCDISFYEKGYENRYFVAQGNIGDLHQKVCEFTQEDIDDLKSHLPEEFGKIVDLAKVEVKDE